MEVELDDLPSSQLAVPIFSMDINDRKIITVQTNRSKVMLTNVSGLQLRAVGGGREGKYYSALLPYITLVVFIQVRITFITFLTVMENVFL